MFTILNPVARHRKETRNFLNILSITDVSFQEVYTEQSTRLKVVHTVRVIWLSTLHVYMHFVTKRNEMHAS